MDLYFKSRSGEIHIFSKGVACDYSEEEATKLLVTHGAAAVLDNDNLAVEPLYIGQGLYDKPLPGAAI